jgi:hypothetical protein
MRRKSRIEGQSVAYSQQLVPKLTQNIHPIKAELLRRCCADCCIIHVGKSIFIPDF